MVAMWFKNSPESWETFEDLHIFSHFQIQILLQLSTDSAILQRLCIYKTMTSLFPIFRHFILLLIAFYMNDKAKPVDF